MYTDRIEKTVTWKPMKNMGIEIKPERQYTIQYKGNLDLARSIGSLFGFFIPILTRIFVPFSLIFFLVAWAKMVKQQYEKDYRSELVNFIQYTIDETKGNEEIMAMFAKKLENPDSYLTEELEDLYQ